MLVVTLQREKCIGCNYCVELCPELFRMSKKDGKTVLLKGRDRKGFHTINTHNILEYEAEQAKKACPVNIISVKSI